MQRAKISFLGGPKEYEPALLRLVDAAQACSMVDQSHHETSVIMCNGWRRASQLPRYLGGTDDSYDSLEEAGPWTARMPHKMGPPLLPSAPS